MLLNLINDLLDLAKLEKMSFQLNKDFFDLTKTIDESLNAFQFYSKQNNIKTHVRIDEEIAHYFKKLYGDQMRFA
jgi:signal transduction histidine kinase